jgi:hypothetical protein
LKFPSGLHPDGDPVMGLSRPSLKRKTKNLKTFLDFMAVNPLKVKEFLKVFRYS